MDVFNYLDNQLGRGAVLSRRLERPSASCRRRPRPKFAVLEERQPPSTFFVTTEDDNGDNVNPTPGSLREAILRAKSDANPAGVQILFNIPNVAGQADGLENGPDSVRTDQLTGLAR
jgi:hypothetical protein